MATLDLSIIIPTLNAAGELSRCLGAVTVASEKGLSLEMIIVDGGSRDGTVETARVLGARVVSS
ncbi:MAG TPA: glycosyltransferase, partial [Rhodospirillaceae bacterium]|nr:glycosyltransferase [Rhodospirillaceae bacterium]